MDEDSLAHEYSSQYYDPVKAHEYYERTKQLKGRRKTSELSKEGKEVWGEAKSNIDAEKKSATKELADKNRAEIEQMRNTANQRKEEIKNKIEALFASIQADLEAKRADLEAKQSANQIKQEQKIKDIRAQAEASIAKLTEEAQKQIALLSSNSEYASKSQKLDRRRRMLVISRKLDADIAGVRKQADLDARKVIESGPDLVGAYASEKAQANARKQQGSESRKQELTQVSEELKGTLNEAKKKYESSKQALTSKYESIYQREFDSIKEKT